MNWIFLEQFHCSAIPLRTILTSLTNGSPINGTNFYSTKDGKHWNTSSTECSTVLYELSFNGNGKWSSISNHQNAYVYVLGCTALNFSDNETKTKRTYMIVHDENNIFDVAVFRKYASYIRFRCASAQTENTNATAFLWSWLCLWWCCCWWQWWWCRSRDEG